MTMNSRVRHPAVALETTLLVHGLPRQEAIDLSESLELIIEGELANAATVGVLRGVPTIGLTGAELAELLETPDVPKANSANLGVLIHRGMHAATTVSATMELASAAGVRVFATGGIGGVHRDFARHLDISADLLALARYPMAVVASGVKSVLDVAASREALETLGVPVVGFGTDRMPAFYLRSSGTGVDARFDDERALARFLRFELGRTRRGVLIANPIPEEDAIDPADWAEWLDRAEQEAAQAGVGGREVTPFILARLREISGGATLRANLALVRANARLAAALAREMSEDDTGARHETD